MVCFTEEKKICLKTPLESQGVLNIQNNLEIEEQS
jgi:hypothetical protein